MLRCIKYTEKYKIHRGLRDKIFTVHTSYVKNLEFYYKCFQKLTSKKYLKKFTCRRYKESLFKILCSS